MIEETSMDEHQVSALPPKLVPAAAAIPSGEGRSAGERLNLTTSAATQFGLAAVDRWDEDDFGGEEKRSAFGAAQRSLQPLPVERDQLDAEYDVGKRKHKPRKQKDV